uniref:ParA family protein n=1 Tax=Vaginimicrobium propionicum TaxID=1871034 RepID=UPI0022B234D4|nr:AAA family ATPase [Vaginimicrobium propionicum]
MSKTLNENVSRETMALPHPAKTRRLVVANQKGGVGKTTTAVNLAAALAEGGQNVLVVDIDPQGNASTALGVDHRQGIKGTYEVLISQASITDLAVTSAEFDNLKVLPATIDLAAAEIELVPLVAREQRLLKAIRKFQEENSVDWIIFDCPPSLSLLTVNAMVAATEVLIPIQTEYYALEGLTQLLRSVSMIREELNADLAIAGVLLTMFDARTKLSAQVAEEIHRHFEKETLKTIIARSVRMSEAPSFRQTIISYDPKSVGAKAYRKVAMELTMRQETK